MRLNNLYSWTDRPSFLKGIVHSQLICKQRPIQSLSCQWKIWWRFSQSCWRSWGKSYLTNGSRWWNQENPVRTLNIYNMLILIIHLHCATLQHLTAEGSGVLCSLSLESRWPCEYILELVYCPWSPVWICINSVNSHVIVVVQKYELFSHLAKKLTTTIAEKTNKQTKTH